MKFAVFVLGFLTGVLSAYLILTRWWWPDVRLETAHVESLPPARVEASPQIPAVVPPHTPPQTPSPDEPSELIAVSPPLFPSPFSTPLEATPPPPEARGQDVPLLQTDIDRLRMRALLLPVQGIEGKSLRDTFPDDRGGRPHQAIDIMAARGTPVLAAGDGRVEKLFTSKPGGLTIYQFDVRGEYCYYYAHLDSYAAGLVPGQTLRRGDVLGYVGSTGNASPDAPHLHFAIFRLGPEKRWWEGTAINAYPLWGAPPVR